MVSNITDEQLKAALQQKYVDAIDQIVLILADVTEACIDPSRAQVLASNAVNEALNNVEGK
jgi:hypothetical protein